MDLSRSIFVAGHRGLVGGAVVRRLQAAGASNLVLRTHAELDLCNQAAVDAFFREHRPDYIILAAARVGGISANTKYPAEFIQGNLAVQTNVIDAAWRYGSRKLCFLGSSCIYPKLAPQPMREECLLTGALEPTNEWYAIAKIAGIKMCQAYRKQYGFDAISLMPTNLYGPGDNFHPTDSHVIPAMLARFHHAKLRGDSEVRIWGTGSPRREFLYADDLADAVLHLMRTYSSDEIVNVGTGNDLTILELGRLVASVVGFSGRIATDPEKPDGAPRKLLDTSRANALGWAPTTTLAAGLLETYDWYLSHYNALRT